MTVTFTIPGDPQALKRHRSARRGERIVQYDPAENKSAKAKIQECWQLAGHPTFKERTALSVTLSCFFARPRSHYGTGRNANTLKATAAHWHVGRPDGDNLIKLVGDALNGYAWHDDSQVAEWKVVKAYADENEPATYVSIESLEDADQSEDVGRAILRDIFGCCGSGCSRCRREAA